MKAKDTAKQATRMSVAMLATYAGGSTLLGIVFVVMYQWQMPFRIEMLYPVLPTALMGVYMAKQWNDFLFVDEYGVSIRPKLWIIIPIALSLYLTAILYAGADSLKPLAGICCMFGLSNALVNQTLADKQDLELDKMDDGRLCRRFTIMAPYAFFIAQYFLLGSSIALVATGPKCAAIVYVVYCVYLFIWCYTLSLSRMRVLAINAFTIVACCVGISVYFLFFRPGITGWLMPFFSNVAYTAMTAIAFAVFGCGIIAIPGLIELTQLHLSITSNKVNYNNRIRIISIALGIVDVCAYFVWVLVPMSYIVLVGYTFGSWFWVVVARFRYEAQGNPMYHWSWISAMGCPILLSLFFFFEFNGTWKEFDFSIPYSLKVPAFSSAGVTALVAGIKKIYSNQSDERKSDAGHNHPIRLMECHIFGLLLAGIIAVVAIALLNRNARACMAMIAISANAIFTVIAQVVMNHGKKVC